MKILVTGATGFTGSYTVPLLVAHGHTVRCFVRKNSNTNYLPTANIDLWYGDLDSKESLKQALDGMDVLINIASIGFGHGSNIVQAAMSAKVDRAIFISTTALFTTLNAASKQVRLAAEEIICNSSLTFTILRPTMIYGSSRDRNICQLLNYLKRWPILPIFGDGEHLQQPVYVGDVAKAIVQSLESTATHHKAYNISGGTVVTYNQLIKIASELLARKVYCLHLPVSPIVFTLSMLERFAWTPPLKAEQILRLNENKVFDHSAASHDFGYQPRSLGEGLKLEIEEMQIAQKNRLSFIGS